MRTIVQLSDLHFGAILDPTLEPLLILLHELKPDLVIISGDLTQRAKEDEFQQAAAYLSRLPSPRLVIPGNHDIPLYDVFRRFLAPLDRYERHISQDLSPSFVDDEVAVVGINSSRSFTFKGGSISSEQLSASCAQFANWSATTPDAPASRRVNIVVTHHPFDIPVALSGVEIVNGAQAALEAFAQHDVDLFLTGHLHLVHRAKASVYVPGYGATLLGAGTATSSRARGEPNSFFVFRIDPTRTGSEAIMVDTQSWNPALNQFQITDTRSLPRVSGVQAPGVPT